ncbi:hypothetical protein BDZ45DRAFT_806805 [Acephala macrosclerotiorum]|nr:hypothetical protein BDZ45DRAFT_806805 [Acephala macrosclerotiorum]
MNASPEVPPKQEEGLQFIHSKLVKSPVGLATLLRTKYGAGNYEVEMRHNVYCIKVTGSTDALDPDEPEVQDWLNKRL